MSEDDKTKEVLEQILAQLYSEQAQETSQTGESYLKAADGQFLGRVSENTYDSESLLNQYGPYGSPYSPTSIFNSYSQYGSPYGNFSINNPYTTTPPSLFIRGRLLGLVTKNTYVPNAIDADAFLYTLENNIRSLLRGEIKESGPTLRQKARQSYIEAADGTFLGKLNPNRYESDSIFNRYGSYGSKYSSTCIFNKYSNYGSQFSQLSSYNRFASSPPKVFVNGKFCAYLTVNESIQPRIHPDEILNWAENNVKKYD